MFKTGDIVLFRTSTPLAFFQRLLYNKENLHTSHVGVFYDENTIFESKHKTQFTYINKIDFKKIAVLRLPKDIISGEITELKLKKWMKDNVNVPYDYINILTALIHLVTGKYYNISSKDKYICSEAVAKMFKDLLPTPTFNELFKEKDPQKIYPIHFVKLLDYPGIEVVHKGKDFLF